MNNSTLPLLLRTFAPNHEKFNDNGPHLEADRNDPAPSYFQQAREATYEAYTKARSATADAHYYERAAELTLEAHKSFWNYMQPPVPQYRTDQDVLIDMSILPQVYRDMVILSSTPDDDDQHDTAGKRLDNYVTKHITNAKDWIKKAPYNYITQCQTIQDPKLIRACLRASLWLSDYLGTYHQETPWPDSGHGAFGDDAQHFELFKTLNNPPIRKAYISFVNSPWLSWRNLITTVKLCAASAAAIASSYAARKYAIPHYKRQQHAELLAQSTAYREAFRKYQPPNQKTAPTPDKLGSTHPLEATKRNTIYNSVTKFLKANDFSFYEVHKGHHTGPGYQTVNGPSDLTKKITEPPIDILRPDYGRHYMCDPAFGDSQVVVLSLCDWFVDLQEVMSFGKPIAIITKECYKLSYKTDEVSMKAGLDNKFQFDVLGGGQYHHHLHRFDRDYISGPLENPLSSISMIGHPNYVPDEHRQSNIFSVERFPCGGADMVVFLTPVSNAVGVEKPDLEPTYQFSYKIGGTSLNLQVAQELLYDEFTDTSQLKDILYYQVPNSDQSGSIEFSHVNVVNAVSDSHELTIGNVGQMHNAMQDRDAFVFKFFSKDIRPHLETLYHRRYIPATRTTKRHHDLAPVDIPPPPIPIQRQHPYWYALAHPIKTIKHHVNEWINRPSNTNDVWLDFGWPTGRVSGLGQTPAPPTTQPSGSVGQPHLPHGTSANGAPSPAPQNQPNGPVAAQNPANSTISPTVGSNAPTNISTTTTTTGNATTTTTNASPGTLIIPSLNAQPTTTAPLPPPTMNLPQLPLPPLTSTLPAQNTAQRPTRPAAPAIPLPPLPPQPTPVPTNQAPLAPPNNGQTNATTTPQPAQLPAPTTVIALPGQTPSAPINVAPITIAPVTRNFGINSHVATPWVPTLDAHGIPIHTPLPTYLPQIAPNAPITFTGDNLIPKRELYVPSNMTFLPHFDRPPGASPEQEGKLHTEANTGLTTKRQEKQAADQYDIDMTEQDPINHLIEEGTPLGVAIGPQVMKMPDITYNSKSNSSSHNAFLDRITLINEDPGTKAWVTERMPIFITVTAMLDILFADIHLEPLTPEELRDHHFTTAQQQRRFADYEDSVTFQDKWKCGTSFVKGEASVAKPAPNARNISAVASRSIVELSLYAVPMKDALATNCTGYLFANNNTQTGQHVMQMSQFMGFDGKVEEEDQSGFDGHQNIFTFYVETYPYSITFNKQQFKQILKLMFKIRKLGFNFAHNAKYLPGYTRMSGDAVTSLHNSEVSLIMTALSRFYDSPDKYDKVIDLSGYSTQQMWDIVSLAMGGGDDVNSYNAVPGSTEKFMEHMGLKLKTIAYPATARTSILGAVAPCPDGSPTMHNQLIRTLGKFHLGSNNSKFRKNQQLANRALGLAGVNIGSNPPLVKALRNIMKITNANIKRPTYDDSLPYNSRFGRYHSSDPFTDSNDVADESMEVTDTLNDMAQATSIKHLQQMADFSPDPQSTYTPAAAQEKLDITVATTQPVRDPGCAPIWKHLTLEEQRMASKDITGDVAFQMVQQIGRRKKLRYIVDLTPGPEVLARYLTPRVPIQYVCVHYNTADFDRANELAKLELFSVPVPRYDASDPASIKKFHDRMVANKVLLDEVLFIIDPPFSDFRAKTIDYERMVTKIANIFGHFGFRKDPHKPHHPKTNPGIIPQSPMLIHLPRKYDNTGVKRSTSLHLVDTPMYNYLWYTTVPNLTPVKITVEATRRSVNQKDFTKLMTDVKQKRSLSQ